jgi:quercetin dioxygenase-like cupin family protein
MRRIAVGILLFFVAASGSVMADTPAEGAAEKPAVKPAVKLANLLRAELELVEGVEVIVSMIEVGPETALPTHWHPGEEFVFVLEGAGTVWQKDKPDVLLKKGDVFKVPLKQVHTAKTGEEGFKALVFRVHKKGEPERVLSD